MRGNKAAKRQRGIALLAVLWLAMALSLLALSTSYLVRTEIEAVRNRMEDQQGYYLARGGIEAAVYSIVRSLGAQAGTFQQAEFTPGQRWLRYALSSGECWVEVMPENAKLSVNQASAEQWEALLAVLGLSPVDRLELAAAIVDWRSPRSSDAGSVLDAYYAALPRPYGAGHAPLTQLEELLGVRGMSTDLFFGRVELESNGQWRKRPPLSDLLTTELTGGSINPNYAPYEVLRTLPGWDDAMAQAVVEARVAAPFRSIEELQAAAPQLVGVLYQTPLTFGAGPVYTLTATGILAGSPVRRSVRALVRVAPDLPLYHRVLAWWDDWPAAADLPLDARTDTEPRSRR